jgi:hypothetical protein
MIRAAIAVLALASPAAASDSVTITADKGLHFIRCTDMFGTASCEFIADPPSGMLTCIALNAEDKPIASAVGFAQSGSVLFPNLPAPSVARLICRR